jgi:hypothetical protein
MNEFKELHGSSFSLENGLRLHSVLQYYETTMITSIENNICNFDYINRFIFSYYKNLHKDVLDGKSKTSKEFRKSLYRELNVKKDIIENTLLCDPKYHAWIRESL